MPKRKSLAIEAADDASEAIEFIADGSCKQAFTRILYGYESLAISKSRNQDPISEKALGTKALKEAEKRFIAKCLINR